MKVRHGYIRGSMYKTFPMFMRRFELIHNNNGNEPLVMFGCYGESDVRMVARHKAPIIMAWMGSDFALFGSRKLWERENIHHVAIGRWMEKDLRERGLSYKRVNLIGSPLVDALRPEPLGNAVYTYLPEKRREYYGGLLVDELQERLSGEFEFIIHTGLDVPQSDMPDVYRRCFAGLRLVEHDGGSETVIEMGLMGRRTVHNGDTPSSMNWETTDDIIDILRKERAASSPMLIALATQVREHIQMTDEWLDLDWWKS